LVKVENGIPTAAIYETFMPCSDDLDFIDDASQTGGLRTEDLKGLFGFAALWPTVRKFIGDSPLVANSATTYMKTLEILWSCSDVSVDAIPYLCTQVLGRKITDLGSFNLEYYAHAFDYELPELANALDKAKATTAIMLGLVALAKASTLEGLMGDLEVQWGAVSSKNRIPCKSTRSRIEPVLKADLKSMRDEFEKHGFDDRHPLFEKYVLITGTLRRGTRSEVEKLLAQVGAFPELSFTRKTNYLVVGYDAVDGLAPGGRPTTKITKSIKARASGQLVEVVDEQAFLNLLEE
jgi:NAD-dependent DNA ligase